MDRWIRRTDSKLLFLKFGKAYIDPKRESTNTVSPQEISLRIRRFAKAFKICSMIAIFAFLIPIGYNFYAFAAYRLIILDVQLVLQLLVMGFLCVLFLAYLSAVLGRLSQKIGEVVIKNENN
jgi:hypothetical protein